MSTTDLKKFLPYLQRLAAPARDTRVLPGRQGSVFAHALGESRMAAHENRDIGAQRQAQRGQPILVPTQLPEVIEAEQGGGGIRELPPPMPPPMGRTLSIQINTERAAGLRLKFFRGLNDQVTVVGDAFELGVQANDTVDRARQR